MSFRADESARAGLQRVLNQLLPYSKGMDIAEMEHDNDELFCILRQCGSAVDAYPSWHPLVRNHDEHDPVTSPSKECGYRGLDHTYYFLNGFITCPYGDGQDVIDSVSELPQGAGASITAERLNLSLYNAKATPILVRCKWERELDENGMIPLSLALPLLLEKELPCWRWAERAETWDIMRPYFLGTPHGARSSLFVSQETGQAMKKTWEALVSSGMFGPVKSRK